ncbi:imidazole glycerol phosphate synthase subunit HisH 2 [Trichinella spiralis]|uniref:imidazole glycerol phosphate synthase subunit HisH 2 n=1 Tax=Trichinella spiralis TaxID=6334 RepID=UPI0001EFD9D1|nr:imidazole glycerol phosphate synthase subunit HisH 2 [Trichinella spiralis]
MDRCHLFKPGLWPAPGIGGFRRGKSPLTGRRAGVGAEAVELKRRPCLRSQMLGSEQGGRPLVPQPGVKNVSFENMGFHHLIRCNRFNIKNVTCLEIGSHCCRWKRKSPWNPKMVFMSINQSASISRVLPTYPLRRRLCNCRVALMRNSRIIFISLNDRFDYKKCALHTEASPVMCPHMVQWSKACTLKVKPGIAIGFRSLKKHRLKNM